MNRVLPLLAVALAPALARAADAVHLQALIPTSGSGAASVLEGHDAARGWTPAGDPRDEGLLFRFEQPTRVDSVRLTPCAGAVLSIVLSADGVEVATAKVREAGTVLVLPHDRGLRSVFVRISGGAGCLAGVEFARGGAAVPVRPPRAVPGSVTASSTLAPIDAYLPSYLFDGRLDFGWVAGAPKTAGVGESVTVRLEQPSEVAALELWNGYQRSPDHFKKNARASRVTILADGKPVGTFKLKDAMGAQKLELAAPVTAAVWTLRVDAAVRGTRYPDLVLSELRFWDAAGPFTVATSDAPQREAALREEIAGGPLPHLLDRLWVQACPKDGTRHLKVRGNHTFVWYEAHGDDEDESATQEVFDGVYVPTQRSGPWARIELYGRRHRIERSWRPYEDLARRETDRIGGGNVELTRLADLGAEGWKALAGQWKGGESAGRLDCVEDLAAAYDELVKRNAILVRGGPFQDLLVEPQ